MHPRFLAVDALRGLAIAGVVLFHLVWDLEFTGFISGIAYHPLWLAFGRGLAGSFMFLVGISLILAARSPLRLSTYAKRLVKIIVAAAAITVVTWFVFPETFIYFGILHAITAATLIGTLFLRAPAWLCVLVAVLFLVAPVLWQSGNFDTRWLAWIGFAAQPPRSNDFVPIFPWVGLTLTGMAVARLLLSWSPAQAISKWTPNGWPGRGLIWMGRRSLIIYLVHQPIMFGVLVPLSWL